MPPALQSSRRRRRAGIRYYRSGPASYAPLFTVAAATVALLAAANLALLRGLIVPRRSTCGKPGRHRQGRSALGAEGCQGAETQAGGSARASGGGDGADQPESPGADDLPGQPHALVLRCRSRTAAIAAHHLALPARAAACARAVDRRARHADLVWHGLDGAAERHPALERALELRFGAYDRHYHFLDATTGTADQADL